MPNSEKYEFALVMKRCHDLVTESWITKHYPLRYNK